MSIEWKYRINGQMVDDSEAEVIAKPSVPLREGLANTVAFFREKL